MKSMKTFFGVLAAASLLFSVNAFAQENANRDENGNVVRGPYETNAIGDNWFVGGAIGANSTWNWKNTGKIPFVTAPGLAIDLTVGKWISPEWGFGFRWSGLTNDVPYTTNPFTYPLFGNAQSQFTADFLINMSSLIDGYMESRTWTWVLYPFAGIEFYGNWNPLKANHEWILGLGSKVFWHPEWIGEKWDLTIDNRFGMTPDAAIAPNNGGLIDFPFALTFGAAYKIGKSGFQRHSSVVPAIIPVPFTTEQYEDLSGKVAELEKENAALKDKIAALENEVAPLRQLVNGQTYLYDNGTFTAVDAAAGAPVTLYFDCGSATLSAREKAHFEYFTKNVVNENTKLSVNGYADKQTGSAKRNQQLSEQRVKTVVDLLKKAGAAEENIESAAHGATVQPFDSAAKNRVVTIEVK